MGAPHHSDATGTIPPLPVQAPHEGHLEGPGHKRVCVNPDPLPQPICRLQVGRTVLDRTANSTARAPLSTSAPTSGASAAVDTQVAATPAAASGLLETTVPLDMEVDGNAKN